MEFIKHDAKKLKRVGLSWRKPRGRKNKTKVGKKGHKPLPSKGFKSSLRTRGMINGKVPILVHSISDLDKAGEGNIIIIGRTVGVLKRKKLLEACASKNLQVVNNDERRT